MRIKYAFIYFDFCLMLFLKENKSDLLKYWINSKDETFTFYCIYNLLTFDKFYIKKDIKEMASFMYYLVGKIKSYQEKDTYKKIINTKFKMEINKFNEYKIDIKEEDFVNYIIQFKEPNKNILTNDYNKLAIFCLDNNDSTKYILQDIIDVREIIKKNNTYKIKLNKNVFFVPIENVTTWLYSFEYKSNEKEVLKDKNINLRYIDCIKIINEYINLTKFNEIPKYCWDIGLRDQKFLLLSEESNQIYSYNQNISPLIKSEFYLDIDLNNIKKKGKEDNNKITNLVPGPDGFSSFLLTKNDDIFCIEKQAKINDPIKIENFPKLNIAQIVVTSELCYIIDKNGILYSIEKSQNSPANKIPEYSCIKIPVPEGNEKYLQIAHGKNHLLCLVKDKNGRGKIYAKGDNSYNQCGINKGEDRKNINDLMQCEEMEYLDSKSIYADDLLSAAITTSGELYVWGAMTISNKIYEFDNMVLVKNETNSPMYVDNIELKKGKLFAFARILENNNYVKKLFSFEIKEYTLKEIKLVNINDNNSRLVPLKIFVDDNKSYVLCVDENNFIKEINENNIKDKKNCEYEISINNFIENKDECEKIKDIYTSDKLNKFISLFESLSEKRISNFIEIIEQIKDKSKGKIITEKIDFNEFKDNLKGKKEMEDLLAFFDQKDNKEIISIFNYLKIKKSFIEKYLLKYVQTCIEPTTEKFFKKIISDSILYLPEKARLEYFYQYLLNKIKIKKQNSNPLIIEIDVDRFKASAFYDKYNENSVKIKDIGLVETIFGQVFHFFEKVKIKDNEFLLDKKARLFKVKLLGENAVDAGGPYQEVISIMCGELQSDYIDLFIKTSNNETESGLLRERYIPNPLCTKKIHKKAYTFIGKLFALSLSSGVGLNLNLHPIIWKSILENEITLKDYELIDVYFYNNIKKLEKGLENKDINLINSYKLTFVINTSNNSNIELKKKGEKIKVTLENVEEYIKLAKDKRINEFETQIKWIKEGLYSVIDKNILQILNWQQLEEMICCLKVLDIQDFKEHTKYIDYNGDEEIIKWFWEWLEKSNEFMQMKYLRFVSGRSRLQKEGFGFNYQHLITKESSVDKLPGSHTCYFTLHLPNYDSQKTFIQNINLAIENCDIISD